LHIKISYFILFCLFLISGIGKSYGQESFFITKKEEQYGVVNSKGKVVIPIQYKEIQEPKNGFFAIKNNKGFWGFYEGEFKIADCLYDNFRFTMYDFIFVQKSGRWGVLNFKGETLVDFRYQYINQYGHEKFKVGLYNQWTLRDFENKVIKLFEFDSLFYLGENVYKFCLAGRYGLADQTGKIITTEFQDIFESTLLEKYPKKQFETIITATTKGDFHIPQEERFDTIYHFTEGFAKFKSGEKYGFVDSLGNIRLVPQYLNTRHFSEGMVAVVLTDKWGFLDKNEKLCIQPYYDEVSDFNNGITVVRRENKFNILNKQGVSLYGDDFDKIIKTYSGNFLLYKNNKVGMADVFGRELVSTKYEEVIELGNSYIAAKEHGLWGVLNKKGDIVIPFNYTIIQYDPEHNLMLTMEPGGERVVDIRY
jgi:hypothetical protein